MIKIWREPQSIFFVVGPYEARIIWGHGSFGWLEGQNAIIRFIRRWWSGWHRWDDLSD